MRDTGVLETANIHTYVRRDFGIFIIFSNTLLTTIIQYIHSTTASKSNSQKWFSLASLCQLHPLSHFYCWYRRICSFLLVRSICTNVSICFCIVATDERHLNSHILLTLRSLCNYDRANWIGDCWGNSKQQFWRYSESIR